MMDRDELTDRYDALGIPKPGLDMCHGSCEGTGWVPVGKDDPDPEYAKAAREASEIIMANLPNDDVIKRFKADDDGWRFVKCLDCNGTGKVTPLGRGMMFKRLRLWYHRRFRMFPKDWLEKASRADWPEAPLLKILREERDA